MFGSSATPFGTGAGFGTGTGKFFSIYIKSRHTKCYRLYIPLLHNFQISLSSFKSEMIICCGFGMIGSLFLFGC